MGVEIEPLASEAIKNGSSSKGVQFNMHKTCASKKSQQRTSTYWDFMHVEIQNAWERLQLISYGS